MTIKKRKRNGRFYLHEYKSVRVDGKIKSVYVRSLGPEKPVIKEQKRKPRVLDRLEHGSSLRAGDVGLLWEIAKELDLVNTIDGVCCGEKGIDGPSPGKLLTTWAINRVIDPNSATKLENWVSTTTLPGKMGMNIADFTKESFLSSLDFVVRRDGTSNKFIDLTERLENALFNRWRKDNPLDEGEQEVFAYDLTTVLFFGVSCPLAELGYNPERIQRKQVNLALVVSRKEKYPLAHFVYEGSRNGVSTIKNLFFRLQESSVEPGTLIWDRGFVSKEIIDIVEGAGWKLICGIPKTGSGIRKILNDSEINFAWDSLARMSKAGHIYASSVEAPLYGKKRKIILYVNRKTGAQKSDKRNETLARINNELETLSNEGTSLSEKQLHRVIDNIVGSYKKYVEVRVSRKGDGPCISWKFKRNEILKAERRDGKWAILSTDTSLTPKEVVNTYLEKDFIEKVFRDLKTTEELEPVRHRLEHRVKAYIFVCILAYRLLSVLQYKLRSVSNKEDTWERADTFLEKLGRVERVQVRLGQQVKTWYLNMSKDMEKTLKKIGFGEVFQEDVGIDFRL